MNSNGHDVAFAGGARAGAGTPVGRVTRRRVLTGALALGAGAVAASLAEPRLSNRPADGQQTVWLNIRVETSTSSQGQHSWASAWTSTDREGRDRVPVDKLRLVLDGHGRQEKECARCDYLRVDEWHDGPEIVKAHASAWSEGPTIGPVESSA